MFLITMLWANAAQLFVVAEVPTATRSSSFDDIEKGTRLVNSSFDTTELKNRMRCSRFCSATPNCKSFNFCHDKLCELNSLDRHDVNASSLLLVASDCVYGGMRAETRPSCQEGGTLRDIADDSKLPNICKIDKKRSDGQWIVDSIEIESNQSAYLKKELRSCLGPFHGGTDCLGLTSRTHYFEVRSSTTTFPTAANKCVQSGLRMFESLDKSEVMLALESKIELGAFSWLGYKFDGSLWRRLSDNVGFAEWELASYLPWDANEPSNECLFNGSQEG